MEKVTFELPAMYGDHHVLEVRRLLLEMPGIDSVYASSSFQLVEVQYNPAETDPDAIRARLDEAGYLGDLEFPLETGKAAYGNGAFFRHTAAYAQTGPTVSFAQKVSYTGRPLWPCPGLGAFSMPDEEES